MSKLIKNLLQQLKSYGTGPFWEICLHLQLWQVLVGDSKNWSVKWWRTHPQIQLCLLLGAPGDGGTRRWMPPPGGPSLSSGTFSSLMSPSDHPRPPRLLQRTFSHSPSFSLSLEIFRNKCEEEKTQTGSFCGEKENISWLVNFKCLYVIYCYCARRSVGCSGAEE